VPENLVSGFRFQVSLDVQVSSAEQLGMPVIRGGAETRARSEAFQHYIENRRSSWIPVFTGMTKKTWTSSFRYLQFVFSISWHLTPDTRYLISATEQNSEDFSGQFCDNFHHPTPKLIKKVYWGFPSSKIQPILY